MNVWGIIIGCVGFLLLYMGIENKSPSQLLGEYRPQSSSSSGSGSTSTPPLKNTSPVNPPNGVGSNQPRSVPPTSMGGLLGLN